MIEAAKIEEKLRIKYGNIEHVANKVFKAVDEFDGRPYAVRYFDLSDNILGEADHLREYQEKILSETYFSTKLPVDLRWNIYLYFISSMAAEQNEKFARAKAKIETDREYARKIVISENDVDSLFTEAPFITQKMPADLASIWTSRLEQKGLGYVLDDDVTVPEAARRIESGIEQKAETIITPLTLTSSEKTAANRILKKIKISGFRPYPERKDHEFGRVNLIYGGNGTGKTSLLEAIEFLYCGQTRRPGDLMPHTSVSADFVGSGDKLLTSKKISNQQLRARNSQWYAKSDLKKLTLCESFGKFNFLDTDAAVHLSVDGSEERIGRDVMRLLLGSGAEKLNDRLERVRSKLNEFEKDRGREISTYSQQLTEAKQRLEALSKAPQISDALFDELCSALKGLDWGVLPSSKQNTAKVKENIQLLLTATQILIQLKMDIKENDEQMLLNRRESISEILKSAIEVKDKLKDSSLTLAQAIRNQKKFRELIAALNAVFPYAEAEYTKKSAEMIECRQTVHSLTARLSTLRETDISGDIEEYREMPIELAASTASALLVEQVKRMTIASQVLKAMEDTQANVIVLRQRLIKLAQDFLTKVSNPDHCPICHTEFESGQLQTRMLSTIIDDSESRLKELQTSVLLCEQEFQQMERKSVALNMLVTFIGDQTNISVSEAMDAVAEARLNLSLKQAQLAELQLYFEDLSSRGLKEDYLNDHLKILGVEQLADVAELSILKNDMLEKLKDAVELEKSSLVTIEVSENYFEKTASRFGVDVKATPEELIIQLRKQISDLDSIVKANRSLSSIINIKNKTTEEIAVRLEQAQTYLQKLTIALAKEKEDIGFAEKEKSSIKNYENQINKATIEWIRLQEAHNFLDQLIGKDLGGELAPKILSENATTIGKIFAVIHTPNEFEIKTEEGRLVIWRRASKKAVTLFEMSAGQRAAFALSLFLAMNSRLLNGPRVLLFDDPIAHVDDMNVLSFLDHLRNLSIKGSKQIFFATADSKLAGLFRQKFRFLGKEFREICLQRL
jgi:energy-coupling factor transporter ATP-binding protein EcfA2